jgi:hypothetical protein
MQKVMFSSQRGDYITPDDLYQLLGKEFDLTLDVCADVESKCLYSYPGELGLTEEWTGHNCWMNPPYGRTISKWVHKAQLEMVLHKVLTVALLPARTDTNWFWNYVLPLTEIRLIRGRLKFKGMENSAPFPSMIVIYNPKVLSTIP